MEHLRETFAGTMECDETTFAGARHSKRGWGAAGKVIVFGIVQRNGLVKALPIPVHNQEAIMREIQAHTREGSLYYTDEWQAYATLKLRGEHVMIRKEKGRPVGRDHINGIEGFWSYAKNWLYPYRGVPRQYFHLYLGEVCYRFNHRGQWHNRWVVGVTGTCPRPVVDDVGVGSEGRANTYDRPQRKLLRPFGCVPPDGATQHKRNR